LYPPQEAAKLLGRPVTVVYQRRNKLNVQVKHWTEEEAKVVMTLPALDAAERLGRTIYSCRGKRQRTLDRNKRPE
ncbi:MAG TPA: hypothetical protein VHR66_20590, partial [Gemmataceae bacterium]|nr:hypothetical protein [Gemmataceae bacterium]